MEKIYTGYKQQQMQRVFKKPRITFQTYLTVT